MVTVSAPTDVKTVQLSSAGITVAACVNDCLIIQPTSDSRTLDLGIRVKALFPLNYATVKNALPCFHD